MTTVSVAEALDAAIRESIALDAPLDERLGVIRNAVSTFNPAFASAAERLVDRLRASEAGAKAPAPGEPMPPFLMPDSAGRLVSLASLLLDGPLVVAFHRGHWCPYCRLHATALGEVRQQVEAEGARIVAIAPDRRQFSAQLKAQAGDAIPILTDIDNGYALSINLAIWVGQEMQDMMSAGGYDMERYQGNGAWMLPIPATFVVSAQGMIAARHIDPDYRRRMDIDELLKAVKVLRQAA